MPSYHPFGHSPHLATKVPNLPEDDHDAHTPAPVPEAFSNGSFGSLLEPVLKQVVGDQLGEISWFRTDWQRGGAITGFSNWRLEDGEEVPVVVKLPVPPCERHWLVSLQVHEHVAPVLYAHGDVLGGYDLAWVIMQRVPHGPIGSAWKGAEFDLLVDVASRFYKATQDHALTGKPLQRDWQHIFELSRKHVHDHDVPDSKHWSKTLKKARKKLPEWLKVWSDRPMDGWCHGDLHLANALSLAPAPAGPALLIDYAEVRVGHWVEDAVYFEHLYWSVRDRLQGRKLCKMIAHARKDLGFELDPHWADYAQIKRNLLAMSTPAMLQHDGDPNHLRACLEVLDAHV
ncbi:phosphotransferase [Poriferisphaera sp. WC338]|uniref:phosphotransferase n=1 Tax=Poriferisphaera sp. WC338 TaxID=3425129 RepID=UPI003D814110